VVSLQTVFKVVASLFKLSTNRDWIEVVTPPAETA